MTESTVGQDTGFGAGAPYCAPPDPQPRAPRLALPPLSCDTHAHICGPEAEYPYAPERIYTPPDALLADYLKMLKTLGVGRAVLVQPSIHGTDNRAMLDAMAAAPLPCRGVAVVDETLSDNELAGLDAAGVRGVRFNLVDVLDPGGGIPLASIKRFAERIKPLGWHAELLVHVDDFPDFDTMFAGFPVEIVVGHMGYLRPNRDIASPGFQALLRLVQHGRCWVKLSGPYRISAGDLPYGDAVPMAKALVEAAPERMVWGTDWPHVMVTKAMPNDGDLCDLLADWIPDPDTRNRVLVDNPGRLYGFPEQ